jgi:prepilin-type N-terminal cleavage/methylation domain-containing protein
MRVTRGQNPLVFSLTHAHFAAPHMLHRRAGFTLLELMLAIAIAVIILMVAIPSMNGMSAERRLRESFERFDSLARKAQVRAVSEQRSWVMVWQPGAILVQPNEPTPEERLNAENPSHETLAVAENEAFTLERPASLLPPQQTPQEFTFWRSGTCEPVLVHYQGPDGWWTAQYHPLTGRGEVIEQNIQ